MPGYTRNRIRSKTNAINRQILTKQLVLNFLEKEPDTFIVFCSDFPLSIVLVGVGDGPWDDLIHCNDNRRRFDNFQVCANHDLSVSRRGCFSHVLNWIYRPFVPVRVPCSLWISPKLCPGKCRKVTRRMNSRWKR